MGYITSATSTTLTAKLTPIGRKKLISNNNFLITSFSLGDSDANYNAALILPTGSVPAAGGSIGPNQSLTNSVGSNNKLKSALILDAKGTLKKAVESQSSEVTTDIQRNGQVVLSAASLNQILVNRADQSIDAMVNLFYSFGLPISAEDLSGFTATTYANGGFADTALSGLSNNKILVIGIDNTQFGETIDGKALKVFLTTTAGDRNIYSTFQNKGLDEKVEDINLIETSIDTKAVGNNIAFLFCDEIKKPNGGDVNLSWATGFNSYKPYSLNGKRLFNMVTDTNVSESADTAVGVAFLDKGFIVITHPAIINNFFVVSDGPNTIVTLDSVSTAVAQNITCIANRGEFGTSTNSTFTSDDTARISEIALYDATGDMIALAKTDRHILKSVNQFLALSVKITL